MNPIAPAPNSRAGVPVRVLRFVGKLLAFFFLLHGLVFVLFDCLPGAELSQTGWAGVDAALLASTRERLGLSGNWLERYWASLNHLAHANLGISVAGGYPVAELFTIRLRNSMPQWLGALAVVATMIPLGMSFCSRRMGPARRLCLFTLHGFLIPQFLAAVAFHAVWIVAVSPWISASWESSGRLIFAVLSATLLPAGTLLLAVANTAHSCAREQFVMTYMAAGMSWKQVQWRLLRNVIIAVQPLGGRILLALATGTLFSELTFSIDGVGKLFVDSLRTSDFPTMQAYLFFVGSITLTVSLLERKSA